MSFANAELESATFTQVARAKMPVQPAGSILPREEDRDDRFAVVAGPDHELERRDPWTPRLPVTRDAVEAEQDLVSLPGLPTDGMRSHVQNVPQPTALVLVDLAEAVWLTPGDAVDPGGCGDGDRPAEACLLGHGSRVDEDTVLQGLGAGVGGNDRPEDRVLGDLMAHGESPWAMGPRGGTSPLSGREALPDRAWVEKARDQSSPRSANETLSPALTTK